MFKDTYHSPLLILDLYRKRMLLCTNQYVSRKPRSQNFGDLSQSFDRRIDHVYFVITINMYLTASL